MEDRLEKFITDNRNKFDNLEPPAGLWGKIDQNIRQENKPEMKYRKWKNILWKAAAVLVVFGISFTVSEMLHRNDNKTVEPISEAEEVQYPELIEAEAYYTSQVNKRLAQINQYSSIYPDLTSLLNR